MHGCCQRDDTGHQNEQRDSATAKQTLYQRDAVIGTPLEQGGKHVDGTTYLYTYAWTPIQKTKV